VSTQEAQNQTGVEQGSAGGPGEPHSSAPTGGTDAAGGQPTEAELRAAYEAELSRITSADMVLQATVSLLNIGARRLGLVGGPGGRAGESAEQGSSERDLEQVRDAIDAVRGLMPVVERRAPQEARPLRDALSQLQMAYARESQGASPPAQAPSQAASTPPQAAPQAAPPQPQPGAEKPGAGPAESSGRLWVPGR
jgi:hypothetical protein